MVPCHSSFPTLLQHRPGLPVPSQCFYGSSTCLSQGADPAENTCPYFYHQMSAFTHFCLSLIIPSACMNHNTQEHVWFFKLLQCFQYWDSQSSLKLNRNQSNWKINPRINLFQHYWMIYFAVRNYSFLPCTAQTKDILLLDLLRHNYKSFTSMYSVKRMDSRRKRSQRQSYFYQNTFYLQAQLKEAFESHL